MKSKMAASKTNKDRAPGQKPLKFRITQHGLTPSIDICNKNNSGDNHNGLQVDDFVDEEVNFCGKCDEEIDEFYDAEMTDDNSQQSTLLAVACDICKTYYHRKCGGLSDELFEILMKYGMHGTHEIPWHCKICRKYASSFVGEMVDMRKRQDKLEKDMKSLQEQIATISKHSNVDDSGGTHDRSGIEKIVKEKLEQEKRQMNIIVSNLPEATSSSSSRGVLKGVRDLFCNKLKVNGSDIENADRIPTEKRSLVRVQMKTKAAKRTALANAKVLHDDPTYKDVYLKPDLTYEQRQAEAKLRQELRERREKGEKNLKIQRGKIVSHIDPPPARIL